jgi:hypothetical protein
MGARMAVMRSGVRGGRLALAFAFGLAASISAAVGCAPAPRGFSAGPRPRAQTRVAILPLANYSPTRDAPDRIAPMVVSEVGRIGGVDVIDAGAVEAAIVKEPWLLMDRIPPDLVDRFGSELRADALLVGSVLAYGHREDGSERVPQVALALRLVEAPGGRVLWSAVQIRDGADGEWLFGIGRVESLEQLASKAIREMFETFPPRGGPSDAPRGRAARGGGA